MKSMRHFTMSQFEYSNYNMQNVLTSQFEYYLNARSTKTKPSYVLTPDSSWRLDYFNHGITLNQRKYNILDVLSIGALPRSYLIQPPSYGKHEERQVRI